MFIFCCILFSVLLLPSKHLHTHFVDEHVYTYLLMVVP